MKQWKEGDVFSWWYKEIDHNSSTQYLGCSQTGVVADNGLLYDTYCGLGINDGRRFSIEDVNTKIEVKFIANLNNYELCREEDQCYYDDKDFLNLSHSNNRGVYYVRKDAVKSLSKMRKILERNVKQAEYKVRSAQQDFDDMKRKLDDLTVESYVWALDGVSVEDNSYLDNEEIK